MIDQRALLRRLEACIQEELGAQGRSLERLAAQEAALRAGDAPALAARGREIEGEVGASAARAQRRAELLRLLAQHWRVDAGALTLGSICERVGPEGERLARLRTELRRAAARTARQLRRNALAARLHQRTWSEILTGVLAAAAGQDAPAGGRLVDAEA